MVYDGTNFEIMALQKLQSLNPKGIAVAGGKITSDGISGPQDISNTFGISDCSIVTLAAGEGFEFTLDNPITGNDDMYVTLGCGTILGLIVSNWFRTDDSTFTVVLVPGLDPNTPSAVASLFFGFQVSNAGA